ncbi:hypothetical protein [Serratia liquefaciens]|uniref:hypothetical protein n=1 Tax=Serratia liquefaciens TaxID=614 RepID=UPI000F745881|nr:hypothetical protein [Serratia liquefaciens]QHT50811.1 hypothetical protein C5686_010925 [Serratia liquefaciens]
MSSTHVIDDIITDIFRRKANIGCQSRTGILFYLEMLGFSHKPGKSDNHRVFTHPALSKQRKDFTTFGVDCGHGMKKSLLPCYPTTVLSVLRKYKDELKEIYDEANKTQS